MVDVFSFEFQHHVLTVSFKQCSTTQSSKAPAPMLSITNYAYSIRAWFCNSQAFRHSTKDNKIFTILLDTLNLLHHTLVCEVEQMKTV